MLERHYRSLVRASALYDLLATAAFATPWTFALVHQQLSKFSALPAFEPLHVLFANLLGSLVVVWALVRLRDPRPIYGAFDALARALFTTWELYYLVAMHGSVIVAFFAAFEVLFGVTEGLGYVALGRAKPARRAAALVDINAKAR